VAFFAKSFLVTATGAILLAANPGRAPAQNDVPPPIAHFVLMPDFHFSDPARDAEYSRLDRESERTLAIFGDAAREATRALKYPGPPAGSPAWLDARAAVERAILARRPAGEAKRALIDFVIRERPKVPPSEAAHALRIWRVEEESLRATSDTLVGLLAALAGIRIDQWPP
jgi:hypothetical protein